MESQAAAPRAESDERSGPFKAWKRLPRKLNFLSITVSLFVLLILLKIFLSGLYLEFDMKRFTGADLALAEEKEKPADPEPNPALDEKRLMLRNKEEELKERETALKRKEEELLPLKKEIDSKIEELNELQTRLTAFAKELAEREQALKDSKVGHLVALYTAMEPARAAAIMEKLNLDTIVLIMANMKGKSAGQILAMMDPDKGAVISERLSRQD